MDKSILQEIKSIAKQDFDLVQKSINRKQQDVVASIKDIKYSTKRNSVVATCNFELEDENRTSIKASIEYEAINDAIYSSKSISAVSNSIVSSISSRVPITAADDDDVFDFDADFEDEDTGDEPSDLEEDNEEMIEDVEYEDPEEYPNIEVDNNIDGHYIVECDRCHGIFISALIESDQVVEYVSGVCPLCEKESDQYIKWVVKPVEF